jgi:hypothetical protein
LLGGVVDGAVDGEDRRETRELEIISREDDEMKRDD